MFRVIESHDTCALLSDLWFWNHEGLPKTFVESFSKVAGKFYMLLLIFADRDNLGVIQQDISSHQNRVVKESNTDIFPFASGFIFVLSHAFKFSHRSNTIQDPTKFCVFIHTRLLEQNRFFRVYARSQVRRNRK